MKPVWKQVLVVLAVLVFVYVIAMPALMGGFGYGARNTSRAAWQVSLHYNHAASLPFMGGGLRWMGPNALLSGMLQLGLLALIVLGSIWLVARALARHGQE